MSWQSGVLSSTWAALNSDMPETDALARCLRMFPFGLISGLILKRARSREIPQVNCRGSAGRLARGDWFLS